MALGVHAYVCALFGAMNNRRIHHFTTIPRICLIALLRDDSV